MMKKNRNKEMYIYELLGIKIFKKIVLKIPDIFFLFTMPFWYVSSKEEVKNDFYSTTSNYLLGRVSELKDISKYKKYLLMNTFMHIGASFSCFGFYCTHIDIGFSFDEILCYLIASVINTYCLMLQRYNWIRINRVLQKAEFYHNRKQEISQKDLQIGVQFSQEYAYTISESKEEIDHSCENLTSTDKLEYLKQCSKYLKSVRLDNISCDSYDDEHEDVISLEEPCKSLKLVSRH